MKPNRILDTNIFVRYLVNDIPEQAEIAQNVLNKGEEGKLNLVLFISTIIELDEVLKYEYNTSKEDRLLSIKTILDFHFLNFAYKEDRKIIEIALEYYNKYNLDLDDCYYLAYTKFKEWELFTFDTKLKTKAKLEGIKRMP